MRLPLALILAFALPLTALADSPKAEELAKARALVRSLGDKSYRNREKAAQELLRMGRVAYTAVAEGSDDADPEVRSRCRKILPVILEQEIKARLDAFLADVEGKNEHNLPGWKRFRDMFGNTKTSRELFADLIRADGRLMEEVEVSAREFAGERLQARAFALRQNMLLAANAGRGTTLPLRDIIQVLFLATKPGLEISPQAAQVITSFTYDANFRQAISGGDQAEIVRKLVVTWIEQRLDDQNSAYAIMNLATNYKLKELIAPALKIATNKKAMVHARGTALAAIGRLGDKEHAALLEPLVADTTQIASFAWQNIRGITQLGDVALAQIIHLHGEKPGDYGYLPLKSNPSFIHSYYYQGFANDDARAAARKQWKEFLEKNKKR